MRGMDIMFRKVPSYLVEKNALVGTIVFTVLCAIVFLNIFVPTSESVWFELGRSVHFFITLGFITVSTLILIMSRMFLYRVRNQINMYHYILWAVAEVLLITLFYSYVTSCEIPGSHYEFTSVFSKSIGYVSMILLLPYTVAALYYRSISQNIKPVQVMNYHEVLTDASEDPQSLDLVNFLDYAGHLKLSVRMENLYYISSEDNYIKIHYTNNNQLKSYMLRCKIKTVEEGYSGTSLVRCHRSYIVNSQKIKMIKKEKEGLYIYLDREDVMPIPVSKAYAGALTV